MGNRRTAGLIDGNGIFASRAAGAGPFVFFADEAIDEIGVVAAEAQVKAPYTQCVAAHVRHQTTAIAGQLGPVLDELGTSWDELLQVEQFIPRKPYADGFLSVSRGPGMLERRRPASAMVASGELYPQGAVIGINGIGITDDGSGMEKEILQPGALDPGARPELGDAYALEPLYNEMIAAGAYLFPVGDWSGDYETGVDPSVKAPAWTWWGSEIRNEAFHAYDILARRLEQAGSGLANLVQGTVYLTDLGDLYELDLVWRELIPEEPPARTVIPVRGLATPRAEDVLGHADNAMRLESLFRAIRPEFGVEREVISAGGPVLGHASEAIRARPLMWTSGLVAGDEHGLATGIGVDDQLQHIFGRLEELCEVGSTRMSEMLMLRAFLTDITDAPAVYSALRKAVPDEPPAVVVTQVPSPLQVEGCTVMVDAVFHVPS